MIWYFDGIKIDERTALHARDGLICPTCGCTSIDDNGTAFCCLAEERDEETGEYVDHCGCTWSPRDIYESDEEDDSDL